MVAGDKDSYLAESYTIAKSFLATRREEANAAKELSNVAYAQNLRAYDKINEAQWKEELKFEKALDKETATESAKIAESKFTDVLDQLAGLSKRKIADKSTKSDTKS